MLTSDSVRVYASLLRLVKSNDHVMESETSIYFVRNVLPLVDLLCALYFFGVSVLTYCVAIFPFRTNLFEGACGYARHSTRVVCGNAHLVMPRLAHRGRRSALNEQVRIPQWALDLLQYFRQQDVIDLRIALRALRWLMSAILDIIREREQRTELDLIEGNV